MNDNEPFQRRVGTRIKNKWTIERLLGVGGMAAVYVGVHTIGRREAIKILHPEVAADRDLRGRFEQEAKAVNRFKHPGVVDIVDIDVTEDGLPFLVMELLEGSSLQTLIKQGTPPDLPTLLRLTDELLDVLAAAHAQGIIHRDIKPDNLFVQSNGKLKVLDFGIARVRDGGSAHPRTRTGTTLGTVSYMPPEQLTGKSDLDARADIFAVGATMFRVLAGRHVHEGETEFDLMVRVASDAAPPLQSVAPGVPAEVAMVVDRALAFERDERYPSAQVMQNDVRALVRGERPPYATQKLGGAATGVAAVAMLGAGAAAPGPTSLTSPHSGGGVPVSGAAGPPTIVSSTGVSEGPTSGAAGVPVSTVVAVPVTEYLSQRFDAPPVSGGGGAPPVSNGGIAPPGDTKPAVPIYTPPASSTGEPRKRSLWLIGAGAVALLACVALGVRLLGGGGDATDGGGAGSVGAAGSAGSVAAPGGTSTGASTAATATAQPGATTTKGTTASTTKGTTTAQPASTGGAKAPATMATSQPVTPPDDKVGGGKGKGNSKKKKKGDD